jgi:single-strand DNA-binding protein
VYIEGPIRTRQWEDRDGNQRTSFNIIARHMQMFSAGNGNGSKPKPQTAMPAATRLEEDNPFTDDSTTESDVPF